MKKTEFQKHCQQCELLMRGVAIEMAKTSAILSEAYEEPSAANKAALFCGLKQINAAFFKFLQESGIAYVGNTFESSNEFAADLKKAFEKTQKEESPA